MHVCRVPGGSAANVCKCFAGLDTNRKIGFLGMIGKDPNGAEYRRMLRNNGVDCSFLVECPSSHAATATCVCLVTPDGQRTMRTYLGAALELRQLPPHFPPPGLKLMHFEGYCLYRASLAKAAMHSVRRAGAVKVSLDLASFEVVRNCWSVLNSILSSGLIDILFCNEDEAGAVCTAAGLLEAGNINPTDVGAAPDHHVIDVAQSYLLKYVSVIVISKGKAGCIAASSDGIGVSASAGEVKVVDTVGAGDTFSAGFLHAWLHGAPLQTCAECGCDAGAVAVQNTGAKLGSASMEALRASISKVLNRYH